MIRYTQDKKKYMILKFEYPPLNKLIITQEFGARPWFYKKYGLAGHNGLDFRTIYQETPKGRRNIRAVEAGIITKVVINKTGGYGTYIQITHHDGSKTIYGHQYIVLVKLNQSVTAGQLIGISDNTGESTGPHLHLGYKPKNPALDNGYKGYIDPLPYLCKHCIKKG